MKAEALGLLEVLVPNASKMQDSQKKMKEVVQDAKQAMERLQQQALKLLRKCSDEDSKKSFKGTVLELKEWIQKDEHVLTWKERL